MKLATLVNSLSPQISEGWLPSSFIAGVWVLLGCLVGIPLGCLLASQLVGLLQGGRFGRFLAGLSGHVVFRYLPGCRFMESIARQFIVRAARTGFKPVLVELDYGCLAPAFLIEDHGNGRGTVFIPLAATPIANSRFTVSLGKVHPLDIPVTVAMKGLSMLVAIDDCKQVLKSDSSNLSGPLPRSLRSRASNLRT